MVPLEALATHIRCVDAAVRRAATAVLDLPRLPVVSEYGANMDG